MTIRAVLFDVGGPLNTEVEHERLIDEDLRSGLEAASISVSDEDYARAWRAAIDSFAPNAYRSVIWTLAAGDRKLAISVYQRMEERSHERTNFELRSGVAEMLQALSDRGLRLGLAANQPAKVIDRLRECGVADYFGYQGVSGSHGYRKPDVRLFLHACEQLDVLPEECVMVGDRIDNDVAPARLLGMRTVRLRTGRHASQLPRSWDEIPDAEANDCASVLAAIVALL